MSVTSLKRSGLRTGQKYFKMLAGNLKFAWFNTAWIFSGRQTAAFNATNNTSRLIHFNHIGEGLQHKFIVNGAGTNNGLADYGNTLLASTSAIGYDNHVGAFNGWFSGSGNYTSSSIAFKQKADNGWTFISGYQSFVGSGGTGAGGFTSQKVPVWMIPVTQSVSTTLYHRILTTTTLPATSWTLNEVFNISVYAGTQGGNQARVALANDVAVYVYSQSSTMYIKYAAVTPSTGAISTTWNNGTLDFAATGTQLGLETINGVFVLTTTSGDRYSSTNGATWTRRTTGTSGTTNNGLQITSGETGYMIGFTYNSSTVSAVQYTTDGITFTSMDTFPPNPGTGATYTDFGGIGVGKGVRYANTNNGTVYFKNP